MSKDGKFFKAINILINSVRLGSFLDGRSNTDEASVALYFVKTQSRPNGTNVNIYHKFNILYS